MRKRIEDIKAGSSDVTIGTGSILRFNKDYEYQELTTDTFTVDLTNKKVGVTVGINLGSNCTDPSANLTTGFELIGGSFMAGLKHLYEFKVSASGIIQYYIQQRP